MNIMSVKRNINLHGIDEELCNSVEERISEFEREHEPDLLKGGTGWVTHIRKLDYAIAIFINLAITILLVITFIE